MESLRHALHQTLEVFKLIFLLARNLAVPEFSELIKYSGKTVNFNPAKDIPSLEGKVILVTGGMPLHPPTL